MDYTSMELDELKTYAKSIGLSVGNIGKDKLIEKIKAKELENKNTDEKIVESVNNTVTEVSSENTEESTNTSIENKTATSNKDKTVSLLDSIASAIDNLEDSTGGELEEIVELPNSHVVRVRSITFGGLTYKSRSTNAVYRWNQIGAEQDMTIAEINEMNNYKSDFLRKPLVILGDEKAIKKFRLLPVYENVAKINDLPEVFKSDINTIERVIDDVLRVNMRDMLISKVRQMYKTKQLVDINIIRLLEDKLKFDLSDSE